MTWRVLRAAIYGTLAGLLVTGVAWFALHRWFPSAGEFGPHPNPAEPWLMRLHGAAAMVCLIVLGALLPSHMLPSWRRGRNRATGLVLASTTVALAATGYLLYYSGGETARAIASWAHLALGLALPAAVALHVAAARRRRKASRRSLNRD